ncbi:tRNA uridine-5-carboxymethylaminomethyl(34) synthesis GTPase MnmE [bacterium]|jgi:tRNA modification GTPase|nr:tRNA uridine-5-carboxymethylaminomethyl(34) synthesis GTPase MnmE [bacterium]MBT5015030.1 tRNA uridine-5-carboxymethylaminomethyl(34) synthesis GTPase MnmE [bacterium]
MSNIALSQDEQTIVAQSTPAGAGALALIRLSGIDAISIADKFIQLPSKKKLDSLDSHTVHYGKIIDQHGKVIDQVMAILLKAPKTFTGQNTIEISCHNNPFIIEAIIEQALAHGARVAQQGEFSKRAVLNDKIDLIQAEAIKEVIHAQSKYVLQQSLAQLEGSFSHWIADIEKNLLHCIALSEASFEFIDEEMDFGKQIQPRIEKIIADIEESQKTFDIQQQIREGLRIALIGSVNAGKSSLFNAILNKNRAIVTNIAGTTRDSIEAGVYRNNFHVTFVDTAGLRETDNVIEQHGIDRSLQEAQQADIILLVADSSQELSSQEQTVYQQLHDRYSTKIITVTTKADLKTSNTPKNALFEDSIKTSSTTKVNLNLLEQAIDSKIAQLVATLESPFLLNKRQFNLLTTLKQQLTTVASTMGSGIDFELLSFHLKEALEDVSELSGKTITQDSMDAIFKEFCIGK